MSPIVQPRSALADFHRGSTARRLVAAVLVGAALSGCKEKNPAPKFDGQAAFGYLQQQVAFGYRIPGTEGHRKEAAWLDSLLRTRADTLVVQTWTHVSAKGVSLELTNYLARFNPAATERVLLLAHWDTRPIADSKLSSDSTKSVLGANDGASGVATLLAIADALHRQHPRVGVDLLFDDGEDFGNFEKEPDDVLMGARYYAKHQPAGGPPLFAVLLDMIGDKDLQIYQEGNSSTGAPEVVQLVWGAAKDLGYQQYFIDTPKHNLIDDHVELQKVGIRAIDVVDFDYPAWHTPDDTIDKVSAHSLQVVGDVMLNVIWGR
ncbi:MAG: M28 family peptidase [Gemmatimonadota bacterium]